MEASMPGPFDRSTETVKRVYRSAGVGIFLLPVVLAAMIALAITQPNFSAWISEAAQAEFTGSNPAQGITPAQTAQRASEIRTVKAD
jgi:hypothetical protein